MPTGISNETKPLRKVRSFMRRESRISQRQKQAFDALAHQYVISTHAEIFSWDSVFNRTAGTVLEIGFGMGDSLAQTALIEPDNNFIGIEVHRPGVCSLLALIQEQGIHNIRIINADAVEVMQHMFTEASLDRVQIFFPDPWPKNRHHKRRLIQPEFARLLAGKMKPGALLHIATDWQDYARHTLKVLNANNEFSNLSAHNDYVARPPHRPMTKYEKRGARLGHSVWDMMYKKENN